MFDNGIEHKILKNKMRSSRSSDSEDGTDTSVPESSSRKRMSEFKHRRKRTLTRKNRRMEHNRKQSSLGKHSKSSTTSPEIHHESNKAEEDNSSSGKEFQTSKLSINCYPALNKFSYHKRYQTASSSSKKKMETFINGERSLLFKTYMNKAFNKFKETCSGFELHMEHVNWRHLKKDLIYRKNANKVIQRYRSVVARLKKELDMQENDLVNFYESWKRDCDFRSTNESSGVEADERNETHNRLMEQSVVSECDSEEIFSASERTTNSVELRDIVSPILGKTGERKNSIKFRKRKKCVDSKKAENLKELTGSETIDSAHDEIENENRSTKEVRIADSNTKNKSSTEIVKDKVPPSETLRDTNDLEDEEWIDWKSLNSNKKAPFNEQPLIEENVSKTREMVGQQEKDHTEANTSSNEYSPTFLTLESDYEFQLSEDSFPETEINETETTQGRQERKWTAFTTLEPNSELQPPEKSITEKEVNETKVVENQRKQNHNAVSTSVNEESVTPTMIDSHLKSQLADERIIEKEINGRKDTQVRQEEDCNEAFEQMIKCEILKSDMKSQLANRCNIAKGQTERGKTESLSEDSSKDSAETNIFADEYSIKRALLDSVSESHMGDESTVNGKNEMRGVDISGDEEDVVEHISVNGENLDNVENMIGELDTTVICIDSTSDDNENERAKVELLMSSTSEASSSEIIKSLSIESRPFVVIPNPKNAETVLKQKSTDELCSTVAERVKKRRVNFEIKSPWNTDAKLMKPCRIVLRKLPNWVLEKYARALRKSRQYLDCKAIKNLTDLDQLERNKKNVYSQNSKSLNKRTVKEVGNTLLDCLKAVENGEHTVLDDEETDSQVENIFCENQTTIQTNEELLAEADRVIKTAILNSSSSDYVEMKTASESSETDNAKNETKATSNSKKGQPTSKKFNSCSEKERKEKWRKNSWRRDKLLTKRFLDSESDDETKSRKKRQDILNDETEENDIENCDINTVLTKKRNGKMINPDTDIEFLHTNSDTDDSVRVEYETVSKKVKLKRKRQKMAKRSSSSDSDCLFQKRQKPIAKASSESDTDSDQMNSSQGTPGKKGRKNIRKVMEDKKVGIGTKQAAKEEEERIKRITERQKLYNESYEAKLAGEEKVEKLVLDFNPETKEELISVHKNLAHRLKPHQADGIKFMWDACFETLERTKTSTGSGCILAHCMGLGKTLQVITFAHTLLNHKDTGIKTVMVVCPLSTVHNWVNEFKVWLKNVESGNLKLYELTKLKQNRERTYRLQLWQRTGGVLIMGYEMFRNLSGASKTINASEKESISKCLISPGPDLVVCDEGHLLKNEDTALSKSMKRIRTLRRIILTGTPLQNNLQEYHCMVQFIKPNLLGTRIEFLNRFVNPITNGQFDDSTESDVKLMKKRAYVLNKMLKGCVQRFDYSVLTPFLPPKQEYVIFVSLTEVQVKMYRHYLDNFAGHGGLGGRLFADFQALQRVCTHPFALRLNAEKTEKANEKKMNNNEGTLKNFFNNGGASRLPNTSSDDDVLYIDDNKDNPVILIDNTKNKVSGETEENAKDEKWWLQYIQPEQFEDMRISAKLILLFGILEECRQTGDKILIFSQSLYSLTLIEKFLKKIDIATKRDTTSPLIGEHRGNWTLGQDYFRLDGATSPENRSRWCKIFNTPANIRARLFLISTRAGGLGINLTAANRVIIFDASWNPSHDVQSIFRIYRFGQKKPCYVYRFLAAGTMEETIYNRQVAKLSLSCRVVDEQQIERHYSNHSLSEFYRFNPDLSNQRPTLQLPKDRVLAEIFRKYKDYVERYHEHDSLLENKANEELDEEERKQAWLEYETERMGNPAQLTDAAPQLREIMNSGGPVMPPYDVAKQYFPPDAIFPVDYQKSLIAAYKNLGAHTTSPNPLHFRNIRPKPLQSLHTSTTHLNNVATSDQFRPLLPNIPNYSNLNRRPPGSATRDIIEIEPDGTNTITLPLQSLLKSNRKPKCQEE